MTKGELKERLHRVEEENQRLQLRIAELERALANARKTSKTSSKPPSNDLVKPQTRPKPSSSSEGRSIGGQPGHPKHERPAFSAEQLGAVHEYTLSSCPCCGGGLDAADLAPKTIQQVEIIEVPIRIEEHRGMAFWCPTCQTIHYAPLPTMVEQGGLFGPRLTALVAYMKGACHASFSTIRKFLRDVVKMPVWLFDISRENVIFLIFLGIRRDPGICAERDAAGSRCHSSVV
jgi:transposase